jgi:hypothetical protein
VNLTESISDFLGYNYLHFIALVSQIIPSNQPTKRHPSVGVSDSLETAGILARIKLLEHVFS